MTGVMPKTLHEGWQGYRDGPLQDIPHADIGRYCGTYLAGMTMAFHRMVELLGESEGMSPHEKDCTKVMLKELMAAVATCAAVGECDVSLDEINEAADESTH